MEYKGWTLLDKVTLVCKKKNADGYEQAWVCDPRNNKQLEAARNWGKTFVNDGWDNTTNKYINSRYVPPTEYTFDNKDFKISLLDSAGCSSQGGKLSFWNCLVEKEDHIFKIGIAANLLLDLLMSSTFVNGKCNELVVFARNFGQLGILHSTMQSYIDAIEDMKRKDSQKSHKTTKYILGHNYTTTTIDETYLAKLYRWYEPIYEHSKYYHYGQTLVGFRRLSTPKVFYWLTATEPYLTKLSDYMKAIDYVSNVEKLPSRCQGDKSIELDVTLSEISAWLKTGWEQTLGAERIYTGELRLTEKMYKQMYCASAELDKPYEFSDAARSILERCNIKIIN